MENQDTLSFFMKLTVCLNLKRNPIFYCLFLSAKIIDIFVPVTQKHLKLGST